MDLSPDITAEDLKVFMEEAEEQLQLLDDDIIKLEGKEADPDLLQGIFRAAHTLKGSSAALGYRPMAQLAHAMESILDQLRQGTLAASTAVIDALLHGLDGLRTLRDDLVASQDSGLDISITVAELEAVSAEASVQDTATTGKEPTELSLDQAGLTRVSAAMASDLSAYRMRVTLDKESTWLSVRSFQVLDELSQVGEVIASSPSREEIEQEKAGLYLDIILTSPQGEDVIRGVVRSVADVEGVEIGPYRAKEASAGGPDEPSGNGAATRTTGRGSQTVRIDVERLDYLMNTVGELVIDRTRMVQISRILESRYKEDDLVVALGSTSSHISKIIDELQEDVMKVRMLPIGTVFNGLPRMLRDLAQNANKQIEFIMEGQETEIDRTVIERIRDPLVHLLRNAVDHGIESPEARREAKKPEKGIVRLAAFHQQGQIVITVADDGRGIDAREIRESTVRKGLISAETAARLSDTEALDLIFMPGLSTAEETTEVSGRGVGMDIAKTNIEAVNGILTTDTKVGQGSTFTLKLSLTLAILNGLLVKLGDAVFAIPLIHVLETLKLRDEDIQTIGGKEVGRLRGGVLPLLRLGTVLGRETRRDTQHNGGYAVVVRIGERSVGLVVDSLMEPQEIVIKSLGDYRGGLVCLNSAARFDKWNRAAVR